MVMPVSTFTDNFSTKDASRWSADAGVESVDDRLQITPVGFDEYTSLNQYSLTDSMCFVEVVQIASSAINSDTWFELRIDDANRLRMNVGSSGTQIISFYKDVSGSGAGSDQLYNATDMRWWRFRETEGTVYWETSPDCLTWTTRHSEATPISISALTVRLRAYSDDASPTPAVFDNLNLPPSELEGARNRPASF